MTHEEYLIDLIKRANAIVDEFRLINRSLSIEEIRVWLSNNEVLDNQYSTFIFESSPIEVGIFGDIFYQLKCVLKLYDDNIDLQPCIDEFKILDLTNKQDLLHFLTKFEKELTQYAFEYIKLTDENKFLLFENPYITTDDNNFKIRFQVNKNIASKFWHYYNFKKYRNVEIANVYLNEIMEGL